MIVRDDLPPTPDWLPESRCPDVCVKAHAECPAHVSQPLTYDGDQA